MKYDGYEIMESENYPNNNVERKTKRKVRINILDIFIVQSIICVAISCGLMITRLIGIGL